MRDLDHRVGDAVERRRLPGYLGVVAVDAMGAIQYVSPELEGRFGVRPDEAMGRSFLEFVDGADIDQAVESFGGVAERPGHHQALQVTIVAAERRWRCDVVAENCLDDLGLVLLNLADTDDRLRSVQLLDAQSEVVRLLALGSTIQETIGAVLGFLERALPGFRAAAYLCDDLLDGRATAAPSMSVAFTQRMATAIRSNPRLPGALALAGSETIIAADLTEPRWSDARETVAGECQSIWSMTICHERGRECFGLIEVYGPHRSHPRDEDWVTLRLVSRLAATGVVRLRLQHRLIAAADIDPLTSTPSRRVLKAMLDRLVDHGESGHAVCFIDLDRLKVVNDSLGHEAGDQLIRESARRLVHAVGDRGVVGRFGGDEFVAVADDPSIDQHELAARCLSAFSPPVEVAGRRWRITASIGVVRVDQHRSSGEILRDADAAMYEAKRSGRNRYHVFDAVTRDAVVRRMHLEQQLSSSIERDEIEAHFQPVVRCHDWKIHSLEALARWPGSGEPWVSPNDFVPLAEELGYIEQLGARMIELAFQMIERIDRAGLSVRKVAVNVSPLQLQSGELSEHLVRAIRSGRDVSRLCLEMTEQHMIDVSEHTLESLADLLDLGVSLAVDDFGTGYSSLGSLHRLPARTLKIDRGLVEQVGTGTGRSVAAAVVGVARAFEMATVAEGVENVEQALVLRELGVDAVQGFLFAAPAAPDELIERLGRAWPWNVDPAALA